MNVLDLENLHLILAGERQLDKVIRHDGAIEVFIGSEPLYLSIDDENKRLVMCIRIGELEASGLYSAAKTSLDFNAENYQRTALVMGVSVKSKTVTLGQSLDAVQLDTAKLVDELQRVEKLRVVARAYLEEGVAKFASAETHLADGHMPIRV